MNVGAEKVVRLAVLPRLVELVATEFQGGNLASGEVELGGLIPECKPNSLPPVRLIYTPSTRKRQKPEPSPVDRLKRILKAELPGFLPPSDLPQKWEVLGNDLLLLPADCFKDVTWKSMGSEGFWALVAKTFKVSRVGIQNRVQQGGMRKSQVRLVRGETGIVRHRENKIIYEFDATKVMFSSGNGTEKDRMASLSGSSEVVLDLYCGIGYFALPFLVHSHVKHLYACEWNPDALDAFRRNLVLNEVDPSRVTIISGDNREAINKHPSLECAVDRVSLGLLPSSREGLPVALRALKQEGGVIHVHENVENCSEDGIIPRTGEELRQLVECMLRKDFVYPKRYWVVQIAGSSKVKMYGPKILHMVFDIVLRTHPFTRSSLI